jgi:hypothetical protein
MQKTAEDYPTLCQGETVATPAVAQSLGYCCIVDIQQPSPALSRGETIITDFRVGGGCLPSSTFSEAAILRSIGIPNSNDDAIALQLPDSGQLP